MNTETRPTFHAALLPAGRCCRLSDLLDLSPRAAGEAWQLEVGAGAVWVTWPGCGDDHFLQAGETLRLPLDGRGVLVETEPRLAPGAARLRLAPVDSGPSCPPHPTLSIPPWLRAVLPRR